MRFASVDDFVRLAGPDPEWMTGQVVAIDGGLGLA
jgi:hypothetical protein